MFGPAGDIGGLGSTRDGGSSSGTSNGGEGRGSELKKGPWTAAEDAILIEYVNKHGEGNWNAVQKNSGLARCGKSCRLRWANHLRPNLKKGAFTLEEESIIVELHAQFGNRWARMASLLPGRTDNEIKNYWNTRVKRHLRQGLPIYPPDVIQSRNIPPSNHNINEDYKSQSTPVIPTSSFTFQTQLPSPTNLQINPTMSNTPTPPFISPLSSPSIASPPPISPLSSPSIATTNANFPTLPLLDFSFRRTPPILQAPLRFKRFSSTSSSPSITSNTETNTTSPSPSPTTTNLNTSTASHNHITSPTTYFSLPLSPLPGLPSPTNSCSLSTHHIPFCFSNLLSTSSSEFQKEIERENEKLCLLLASVTQPDHQLPSTQLLSPSSQNWNSGITTIPTLTAVPAKFGRRRIKKKKYGMQPSKGKRSNTGLGAADSTANGFSDDDLLQEAKALAEKEKAISREQSPLGLQDAHKSREPMFNNFSGIQWDLSSSLSLSSDLKPNDIEGGGQFNNNNVPEDLTKPFNFLPSSSMQFPDQFYKDDADETSLVITDDHNIEIDMQHQITSLFPTAADHGSRTVGSCSWDNLPRIY